MFKKIFVAILVAMPMALAAQSLPKFGVVEAQSILEALPEFTQMKTQLAAASQQYETELGTLRTEFERKYGDFQQLPETTPAAIRERRMQELQELNGRIEQFVQSAQEDLQRQQAQLMEPLNNKVVQAIQTVGTDGGYVFIFDKNMPYFSGATVVDVTNDVKRVLNIQ